MRRILVLLLVAAAVGMTATAEPAAACTCAISDQAEHIARAEVIFTGRFVATDPERLPSATMRHTFAVDRVYKGTATADQAVSAPGQGPACGLSFPSDRYVVFAYRAGDELRTNLCTGTGPIAEDEIPAGLGSGVAPLPPTTTEPPSTSAPPAVADPDSGAATSTAVRVGLATLVAATLLAGTLLFLRAHRRASPHQPQV